MCLGQKAHLRKVFLHEENCKAYSIGSEAKSALN